MKLWRMLRWNIGVLILGCILALTISAYETRFGWMFFCAPTAILPTFLLFFLGKPLSLRNSSGVIVVYVLFLIGCIAFVMDSPLINLVSWISIPLVGMAFFARHSMFAEGGFATAEPEEKPKNDQVLQKVKPDAGQYMVPGDDGNVYVLDTPDEVAVVEAALKQFRDGQTNP